jgi:MFS family permease
MNSVTVENTLRGNDAENTRLIILISCVATIGGFLFGFDSGVINGTVDGLRQTFRSSSAGIGFAVASMLLGCAIGAFFAGRLADRWGRRTVLIISAVLFLLSALGAGSAMSSWYFVAARVLGGFAVGAASVMAPAYIAEVASARYRGRLATVRPERCGWARPRGAGCSGCSRFRLCCFCCCCCRFLKVRATSW